MPSPRGEGFVRRGPVPSAASPDFESLSSRKPNATDVPSIPAAFASSTLSSGRRKGERLADGHQFYLSGRALGFDGKYYIATPSRQTWSMDLYVYDPASNTLEERGEIVPGLGGEVRPLAVGSDGRIYGTGTRDKRVGLYIYDPKAGKVVKDFGPIGPSHPNGAWSRYVMGVDDTHALYRQRHDSSLVSGRREPCDG